MSTFGPSDGLRFELTWTADGGATAAELTRGELVACIDDQLVWGDSDGDRDRGIAWTWIELVEHLASVWTRLEWEEAPPLDVDERIDRLRVAAEARWETMPKEERDREAEKLYGFETAHDLAAALQGAWPPSLWLVREGTRYFIGSKHARGWYDAAATLSTLSKLGDAIVARALECGDERARVAAERWRRRRDVDASTVAATIAALDPDVWKEAIEGTKAELVDPKTHEPTELVIAARMLPRAFTSEEVRAVLTEIGKVGHRATPELDRIARAVGSDFDGSPYDAAVDAAHSARTQLSLSPDEPCDIEAVLKKLGVVLKTVSWSPSIDAVACWGPRHGPAVFVNKRGTHARDAGGRRATLAHELCHLLLDRDGTLPLADAVGGRAPRHAESRARAFAAELLLPRAVTREKFAEARTAESPLRSLARRYRVSMELAAWQVRNSRVALSPRVRRELRGFVRDPGRF